MARNRPDHRSYELGSLAYLVGGLLAVLFVLAVIFMPGNHQTRQQAEAPPPTPPAAAAPGSTTGSGTTPAPTSTNR